jgi:uncharacterized membrane protein YfcA
MGNFLSTFLGPVGPQEPSLLIAMMGIVLAGAFVTSGFGIGGGILMTPLFILLLPPKFAIGLLGPLMLLMSGTGVRQYWGLWSMHSILVLLPSSLVGIWLGTYLLAEIPPAAVSKTVGALAIAFGIIQFLIIDRPDWRDRLRPGTWQGVGFGFGSGITTALAHSGGIIFSFYLLPHSRTKEIFVSTALFLFFASGIVKIGTYAYYGILTFPILLLSLTLVPPLILGSIAGKRFNRLIPNKLFMRLICILVGAMGIKLTFW